MNEILEAYYAMEAEVDALIATEADEGGANTAGANTANDASSTVQNNDRDTNTTTTRTSKLTTAGNAIHDKIATLIEKFIAAIMTAIKRLKNLFQRMMVSDKGFEEKLRSRERDVKPLDSLNITSWNYKEGWLQNILGKMEKLVMKAFQEIMQCSDPRRPTPTENEILKLPIDQMVPALIKEIVNGTPNSDQVRDVASLLQFLQTTYRGKKTEATYRSTDLSVLINRSRSHRSINLQFQKKLERVTQFANQLNTRKNLLKSQDCSDEQKRDFMGFVNKGLKLYSMYETVLRYAYELEIERCLSARLIVQKFYQF